MDTQANEFAAEIAAEMEGLRVSERATRGKLAGLSEVAMRCVAIAERREPLAAATERGAFQDIAHLLRKAVLAAT